MKKRLFVAAAAAVIILSADAQINSPSTRGYISRAVDMYNDGNYFGCIDQLSNIDTDAIDPSEASMVYYYRALATVHTQKDIAASMLVDFLYQHPASPLYNDAMLAYGDCYYGSDYSLALAIYKSVDPNALSEAKLDDLLFRMAYCYMKTDEYDRALPLLKDLEDSAVYADAAKFYQGYIAYSRNDLELAESIFKQVDTSEAPGNMADFYLCQIYYTQGKYAQALTMAKNAISRSGLQPEFTTEAYRIAGEAAYALGQQTPAVNYLTKYVELTDSPMPAPLYILGLHAYNQGKYDSAIQNLKPATEADDAMGQSAYLYMGQAYMHLKDYNAAAMAFDRALNMAYDSSVQETAYYNYAVASMNGGKAPFASTVDIFSTFLKKYPRSKYAPEVQKYIISSYLTDGNYAAALASINQMPNPSEATLAAKQQVLCALGKQALANSRYKEALQYLTEADALAKYDKAGSIEVALALGEACYRDGKYTKAEAEISKYLKGAQKGAVNRPIANYDMGYALYAQKKYAQAVPYFKQAIASAKQLPLNVVADSWNRLGDCYYYDKDFAAATKAYNEAYTCNPAAGDYPLFQKALMAGYQRKYTEKINALKELKSKFPSSALLPDALLETTESYIQLGDNNKAIATYKELISTYPTTAQARQGYLQMAMVILNTGDKNGAYDSYCQLIKKYPSSDEARQAVDQAKRIAASTGRLNEFITFLDSTDGAPVIDESEVELLTFENAEKEYLANGKLEALEAFVEDYPESSRRPKALAYLCEGYYMKDDPDAAFDYAAALVEQYPDNSLAQQGLITKAQIEEKRGKTDDAIKSYKQLAKVASSPQTVLSARMGILRLARQNKDYDTMLETADAVLASSGVGYADIAEATYCRGEALNAKGKTAEARKAWENAAPSTDNVFGAQSLFALSQSYFNSKDYKKAMELAEKLTASDTPHVYWVARGFILISDIYDAQGDKFSARQYLEAVKNNYDGPEADIREMVDKRLK